MRLTYATDFDITNINNWSGLGFYYDLMLKNAGFELNHLNNINPPNQFIYDIKRHLLKRTMGQICSTRYNAKVSKKYAEIIRNRTEPKSLIFSPHAVVLANLDNRNKRILYTDATFDRLFNLYPNYSFLSKQCISDGYELDRMAIQNSDLLIYSSQWAADSAINYYHADQDKILIAPFGANLARTPTYSDIKSIISKRLADSEINILLLGVDWIRKGGGKAIEVINQLNQNGLKATLHIAGFKDKVSNHHKPYIINYGFIEKGTIAGEEKLAELFSKCHFLLLPTIADCTPVVFSEASAYGMPIITSNVGGNSCIVKDNENGKVFELDSFLEEAVNYISQLINSPKVYEQICYSAYDRYCAELNWDTTGKKIYQQIKGL